MDIYVAPGVVLIAITAVLCYLLLTEPGPLAKGMRFVLATIPMTKNWPFRGVSAAWLGAVALSVSICWVVMAAYWAFGFIELRGEQTWGFVILCAAVFFWTALVLDQISDLSRLGLQQAEQVLLARLSKRWPDLRPEGSGRRPSLGDLVPLLLRAERRAEEERADDEDAWYRSLVEGIF